MSQTKGNGAQTADTSRCMRVPAGGALLASGEARLFSGCFLCAISAIFAAGWRRPPAGPDANLLRRIRRKAAVSPGGKTAFFVGCRKRRPAQDLGPGPVPWTREGGNKR